ncbi:MAG: HigA family addiction module antitoxin [Elusimicrobiota bacterium]
MMRLPKNRPPEHPGEILREEFIEPLGLTQEKLADALGISFRRVNEIVNGKRGVTAETALLLADYFRTTATLWMNLQAGYDLYAARKRLQHSGHKLAVTA